MAVAFATMDFRLLVVASTLSCVFTQAPGDSASLCVEKLYNNGTALVPNPFFALHPVYRANVRQLMDSRDYVNLLDTPNPVWQQVDNDTNNAADTITSWTQQTGNPCEQTVLVCGFDKGPQSNWLIFQHISRRLPDGRLLDYVTAQFDFQLNGCDVSRQCRQSFDVYRWATSTPNPVAARNIDNYQQVQRVSSGDTSATMRTNVSVTIDLRSSTETGVYIAAVDLSTCVILHRVLVFYYVCPADSSNLITRSETIAPSNGVTGECVENSSVSGIIGKPLASCTATGTWDIISGCECDPGFQGLSKNMTATSCSECPVGTFSDSVSNSACQTCPSNSEATQPGLTECPCVQIYYRAPDEKAGDPCTQPPSAPRNVSVLSVTNTSAVLSWLPPEDDGGRNSSEIFYTINADGSGASVTVMETVNITMAEVTGLTPFSQYTFYVISENAVSSQARDTGGRSSSTSATTPEGECPVGTFSDSVSNSACQTCPANSEATQPGLTECPCIQTYYRAPDRAGETCTQPPSAPRNVSVLSVTNTSAVLSWLPPQDDGGRNHSEIFYTIKADGSGASVTVVETVNITMAEVTGLTPFSQYTFYVISENAVSSQARDTDSRSSSTSATTPEGAAGTVSDISAPRDSVVSWAPPNPPQGIILHYNIKITKSDTGELVQLILMVNRTTFDVSSEVMSAGAYSVQVQAVTGLGPGSFSAPVNVTVEGHSASSDNTGAIVAGVIAAIIVFICVTGILLLVCIIWLKKKKSRRDENHIYETPDYIISPALPPRNDTEVEMKANNAYSTALPPRNDSEVEMKANNAYSTALPPMQKRF